MGQLIALIGRNGAGKSNILLAIAVATGYATQQTPVEFSPLAPIMPGKLFDVELDFECNSKIFRYRIQLGFEVPSSKIVFEESLNLLSGNTSEQFISRSGPDVKIRDRDENVKIGELASCLPALATLLPATDQVVPEIKSVLTFLSAVRYYPIDEPAMRAGYGPPLMANQYNAWLATFESTGTPGDSVLNRLIYMQEKRPDDYDVLKSLLGRGKLGLIDDIHIVPVRQTASSSTAQGKSEIQFYVIQFNPNRGDGEPRTFVMAEGLSAGTRRILRILVSAIFDRSSVMLIEQPEDSLHQGLTKKLIGLIQANLDMQIILSSHSSALLNKLHPESIRLVSLQDGFTVARQLTEIERNAAEKFLNSDGPLYDFLEPLQ
jgi:predicted ATPase